MGGWRRKRLGETRLEVRSDRHGSSAFVVGMRRDLEKPPRSAIGVSDSERQELLAELAMIRLPEGMDGAERTQWFERWAGEASHAKLADT